MDNPLNTAGTTTYLYLLFRARNPLSIADELFSLLQPIFFWLANILEFYNYLTSHQPSLNLTPPTRESGDTDNSTGPAEQARTEDESPLVTLKNVMEYSFQQAFYPVSKVCIVTSMCSNNNVLCVRPMHSG